MQFVLGLIGGVIAGSYIKPILNDVKQDGALDCVNKQNWNFDIRNMSWFKNRKVEYMNKNIDKEERIKLFWKQYNYEDIIAFSKLDVVDTVHIDAYDIKEFIKEVPEVLDSKHYGKAQVDCRKKGIFGIGRTNDEFDAFMNEPKKGNKND